MHHVVVVHHEHAQVALGAHPSSSFTCTTRRTRQWPGRLRAELHDAADLKRLHGRQAQPHARAARLRAGAVVAHLEHEGAVDHPDLDVDARWERRACRRCGAPRPAPTGPATRAPAGTSTPGLPLELERHLLVAPREPVELAAQRHAGVHRRGRERPLEGVAQVGQRRLHLVGAAAPRLVAQPRLRPERQRDAEQALHHALVDLAGEVDPGLEQPRAALLVGRDAHARGERRRLADRPHGAALVVVQLERLAAAVREDHAEPAAAGRHGGARERGQLGEVGVAGRHPALEVIGHLHHPVLGEGHLGDRRLLEAPVHAREQVRVEPVAAHGDHEPARLVVEHQPGAPHRRLAAERLAEAVVEAAAAGPRALVELGDQLDDHVERVGAREGACLRHPAGFYSGVTGVTQGISGCSDSLSVCSEVSETMRR